MTQERSLEELKAGRMPERYWRNFGTIGLAGQLRLLQAKVVVVGAGGLGGYVLECLARQGVGQLVVIDGDHFYPIQQARSFFTQIVRHFPHAFSAMTAWQKQPSTSER